MSLRDKAELEKIKKHIQDNAKIMSHNNIIFQILEGELLKFILEDLQRQLTPKSFDQIKQRVAPINVLKRLIDKLSMIYATGPTREILKENKQDSELLTAYQRSMNFNQKMNVGNENFNAYKNTWMEPYLDRMGKPRLRSLPSDRFTVLSLDPNDRMSPTHLVKFMGKAIVAGKTVDLWWIYTDDEFAIITSELDRMVDSMRAIGNPDGINPFKTLPGVYVNRSENLLIPIPDSDTLQMTKIFPILLSDLNFAVMYQSFSIIFGIDVDDQNIEMNPNAFWRFKSDKKGVGDSKPEIGVIKPEVDIDQVINLIQAEVAMWFSSKNVRPGAVGKLTGDNFSSGIAKMVDEMDTFEDRQKQVGYFEPKEDDLWHKIAHNFHPVWTKTKGFSLPVKGRFSTSFEVQTKFTSQKPLFDRKAVIEEVAEEMEIKLLDRFRACQRLNPDKSEQEIQDILDDADADSVVNFPISGDGHVHETPDGTRTGGAVDVGNGLHIHNLPGKGETEPSAESPTHTHNMPDGRPTGPPIESTPQAEETPDAN